MKNTDYDVIVVGAGHAGCEAALACARTGLKTLITTLNLDGIGFLPCNPSIGGTAKGHLVFEIDALGGEMGKCADKATIHRRMLNEAKGPAVHSLRVQVDKVKYHEIMKSTLENQMRDFLTTCANSRLYTALKLGEDGQIEPEDFAERIGDTYAFAGTAQRNVHHYRIEKEETKVTYENQEVIADKINEVNSRFRNMESATQSTIDSIVDDLNREISALENSRDNASSSQRSDIDNLRMTLNQRLNDVERNNNIKYKDIR